MKIEIEGAEIEVKSVAGLELFTVPEKYMIIFIVSSENPEIIFEKKISAKVDDSDAILYLYNFKTEVSPDAQQNALIAATAFPPSLHRFILFFSPLNKNVAYLIPLKVCAWYVDSPIERLLEMHDFFEQKP
ncbi:MAG: hypothetical protein QXW71_05710, partial [Thermoplasmata archaeon]